MGTSSGERRSLWEAVGGGRGMLRLRLPYPEATPRVCGGGTGPLWGAKNPFPWTPGRRDRFRPVPSPPGPARETRPEAAAFPAIGGRSLRPGGRLTDQNPCPPLHRGTWVRGGGHYAPGSQIPISTPHPHPRGGGVELVPARMACPGYGPFSRGPRLHVWAVKKSGRRPTLLEGRFSWGTNSSTPPPVHHARTTGSAILRALAGGVPSCALLLPPPPRACRGSLVVR